MEPQGLGIQQLDFCLLSAVLLALDSHHCSLVSLVGERGLAIELAIFSYTTGLASVMFRSLAGGAEASSAVSAPADMMR